MAQNWDIPAFKRIFNHVHISLRSGDILDNISNVGLLATLFQRFHILTRRQASYVDENTSTYALHRAASFPNHMIEMSDFHSGVRYVIRESVWNIFVILYIK